MSNSSDSLSTSDFTNEDDPQHPLRTRPNSSMERSAIGYPLALIPYTRGSIRLQHRVVLNGLEKQRQNNENIDHYVVCQDDKYPVHKHVLAMYSSVFATQLSGTWAEATENVSDLSSSHSRQTVREMIFYFYTGAYGLTIDNSRRAALGKVDEPKSDYDRPLELCGDDATNSYLVLDVRMAAVGQYYDVRCLRNYAAEMFSSRCDELDFNSHLAQIEFRDALFEAEGVLEHDSALSRALVDIAQMRCRKIFSDTSLDECIRNAPHLTSKILNGAFKLLDGLLDQPHPYTYATERVFRCSDCKRRFETHVPSAKASTWINCPWCEYGATTDYWRRECESEG